MSTIIPSYDLYGEPCGTRGGSFFNFEWIPERSCVYNWQIPPHSHKSLIQLLHFQQGSAEIFLNNVKTKIYAPCLLLVPAGTVHSLNYSRDVDGPVVTASQIPLELAASALIPDITRFIRQPAFYVIKNETDLKDILDIYLNIEKEFKKNNTSATNTVCTFLFAILMTHILRISKGVIETKQLTASSKKTELVDRFLSNLHTREKPHASLKIYARELGVTPGHLSRTCREILGKPSLDVIDAYVIQEAQKNLIYTSKRIQQLATLLGFSDVGYFARFFRKHLGMSPMEFRKMASSEFFNDERNCGFEQRIIMNERQVKIKVSELKQK